MVRQATSGVFTMPTITQPDLLLRPRDAALALATSERKLWELTRPRGPIPCVRVGRSVRYDPRDLHAYIDAAKQ